MQVWQIPIRQPNGSSAPASSPATRIGVPPSELASTPLLVKRIVPPPPAAPPPPITGAKRPLPSAHRLQPLPLQQLRVASRAPVPAQRVEHLARAGDEGAALPPVGAERVELVRPEALGFAGDPQVRFVAAAAGVELAQLPAEDHAVDGAGGVDVDDVVQRLVAVEIG